MITLLSSEFTYTNELNNAIANITEPELKREIWNARDNDGNTALMIAVKKQRPKIVNTIIDAIASITDNGLKREILNARDNDDNIALMIAVKEQKWGRQSHYRCNR